ncbi:hypothetical protein ANTQUA_LOCUS3504 [Anthophora quadrimaculata]
MAWFPEESHPGGMWQGADIQVSDMRQKVQTQAPLAITREMHAPCQFPEEVMVVFPVWQTVYVERLVEETPAHRVRQGSYFRVSDLWQEVQAQTSFSVSR